MSNFKEYNNGYNKAVSKLKHLDDKYALMWAESNIWQVPSKLTMPLRSETPEHMFISGAWAVLESLRNDGVISEKAIDKHWNRLTDRGDPTITDKKETE